MTIADWGVRIADYTNAGAFNDHKAHVSATCRVGTSSEVP